MADPSFAVSARRHLDDARYLHSDGRHPNADHLSGLAAECALKALVVEGLGGQVKQGFAFTADEKKLRGHIDAAWAEIAALADGRPEPEVLDLLTDQPFADWRVDDRYSSGIHIDDGTVEVHLIGATRAIKALEAVQLSNMGGRA